MVLPNEATKILIEFIPDLKKMEDWDDYYLVINPAENPEEIHPLMTVLGRYVEEKLNKPLDVTGKKEIKNIFNLIERLIKQGNNIVKDAANTCFLENLINYTSAGRLEPEQFIHYLGPESKAYCKAWDEFTGVKTPGLWDE
jgi:hypothetical protein